ncbi:MAG: NUDIX hydrolase [Candidatus Hodarchaeales archaeon]
MFNIVKSDVLWENTNNIEEIKWLHDSKHQYHLSNEYFDEKNRIWNLEKEKYPEIYDGTLLFLKEFNIQKSVLNLTTGTIKFSTVLTCKGLGLNYTKGYGVLGVQCLIFSPNSKYILIGKRKLNQSYCPGNLTIPGGMLEESDVKISPEKALMREIYEEVDIPLEKDVIIKAILREHNALSAIVLLQAFLKTNLPFDKHIQVESQSDEWEGNLKWISLNRLSTIDDSLLMEGLSYYQKK